MFERPTFIVNKRSSAPRDSTYVFHYKRLAGVYPANPYSMKRNPTTDGKYRGWTLQRWNLRILARAPSQGVAPSRRACFTALSALATGFILLSTPLRTQFVYTANANDNTISGYSIGSNGALAPLPGSPFAAGSGTGPVVVDPTGKFVYVINEGDATISAYSIGSNGALTPVPGSPFSTVSTPISAAVDRRAPFIYV